MSKTLLKQFFIEIYDTLKKTEKAANEIWCEASEIDFLKRFNDYELRDFLRFFESFSIQKGKYLDYIVINKILFVMESVRILQSDIKEVSALLDYKGFESLIKEILIKNNYKTTTNFRFTDKSNFKLKTLQKRYEIDVIGIYLNYGLVIDAKQWKHKDTYASLNRAANLQFQRVLALKKNQSAFTRLIHVVLGMNPDFKKKLPLILIPIMVTIEDNFIKINDNQIPLVSIYELNSFLQEIPNNLDYFKKVMINKVSIQKQLLKK
ncbi:MAG: hypothetical protein ACFE8L_05800 [Candidatus Hodarchaeota archaeon]